MKGGVYRMLTLLHFAIFGDKKNSLRSNSFLSLSENRCVSLYAAKMRSDFMRIVDFCMGGSGWRI